MKMTKMIATLALAATVAVGAGSAAQADKIAASGANSQATNIQFSQGGPFALNITNGYFISSIGLANYFSGVTIALNSGTGSPTTNSAGTFTQNLGAGTFSAFSGGTDLLSGSFSGAVITGKVGDVTGNLIMDNATYDAASTELGTYSTTGGSLSVTYGTVNGTGGYTEDGSGQLQAFSAVDSTVYNAVPQAAVPETGTGTLVAIGFLGLLATLRRARKARKTIA